MKVPEKDGRKGKKIVAEGLLGRNGSCCCFFGGLSRSFVGGWKGRSTDGWGAGRVVVVLPQERRDLPPKRGLFLAPNFFFAGAKV